MHQLCVCWVRAKGGGWKCVDTSGRGGVDGQGQAITLCVCSGTGGMARLDRVTLCCVTVAVPCVKAELSRAHLLRAEHVHARRSSLGVFLCKFASNCAAPGVVSCVWAPPLVMHAVNCVQLRNVCAGALSHSAFSCTAVWWWWSIVVSEGSSTMRTSIAMLQPTIACGSPWCCSSQFRLNSAPTLRLPALTCAQPPTPRAHPTVRHFSTQQTGFTACLCCPARCFEQQLQKNSPSIPNTQYETIPATGTDNIAGDPDCLLALHRLQG